MNKIIKFSNNKQIEKINIEREEFEIYTKGYIYAFGVDDDGYYCFKWDSEFENILDKKMFISLEMYSKFISEIIERNENIVIRGAEISLASCKSRFTLDKLRRELICGLENIFSYSETGSSFGFNHTEKKQYMCYTDNFSLSNAICQEFNSVEELLSNANINGQSLPELIELYNIYMGKLGKDLFL